RQRHQHVAGRIDGDLQPQRLRLGAHQVVRALLARTVGVAGDADAVEACLAQRVEQTGGEFHIGGQVGWHGGLRLGTTQRGAPPPLPQPRRIGDRLSRESEGDGKAPRRRHQVRRAGRVRADRPNLELTDMAKPVLLVTRRLPQAVEARATRDYEARLTASDTPIPDVLARAAGADAILTCPGDHFNAELIGALPDTVKVIATFSVGHDHIDVTEANGRGIAVCNTPEVLSL